MTGTGGCSPGRTSASSRGRCSWSTTATSTTAPGAGSPAADGATGARRGRGGGLDRSARSTPPRPTPTSALLDQPLMIDGYKAFMPAFADEFDDLAELGTRQVTHEVVDGAPIGTRLELIPAAGHTAGDLMVLVDDSILFAGDVCFFGVTPLAFQGDPAAWVQVLDLIPDLAEIIVPGHGPIGGLPEVGALRHHLAAGVD